MADFTLEQPHFGQIFKSQELWDRKGLRAESFRD